MSTPSQGASRRRLAVVCGKSILRGAQVNLGISLSTPGPSEKLGAMSSISNRTDGSGGTTVYVFLWHESGLGRWNLQSSLSKGPQVPGAILVPAQKGFGGSDVRHELAVARVGDSRIQPA